VAIHSEGVSWPDVSEYAISLLLFLSNCVIVMYLSQLRSALSNVNRKFFRVQIVIFCCPNQHISVLRGKNIYHVIGFVNLFGYI